jgi:hypothetical protein
MLHYRKANSARPWNVVTACLSNEHKPGDNTLGNGWPSHLRSSIAHQPILKPLLHCMRTTDCEHDEELHGCELRSFQRASQAMCMDIMLEANYQFGAWIKYLVHEAPKLRRWVDTMRSRRIGSNGGKFLLSQGGQRILLVQQFKFDNSSALYNSSKHQLKHQLKGSQDKRTKPAQIGDHTLDNEDKYSKNCTNKKF